MEITIKRRYNASGYTIGDLLVNGKKFCETLEDTDRGLFATMTEARIREVKVAGKTAIPRGIYRVQMGVVSPKFRSKSWAVRWGGKLPRLLNVPGYEGVLIHVGNYPEDTEGCLLVGENKVKGGVVNSVATFDKLMAVLVEAEYRGEQITIDIQ